MNPSPPSPRSRLLQAWLRSRETISATSPTATTRRNRGPMVSAPSCSRLTIQDESCHERAETDEDERDAPGWPVEPPPVLCNQEQRGARVQQSGVIETLALPALRQERHAERNRQVDPARSEERRVGK